MKLIILVLLTSCSLAKYPQYREVKPIQTNHIDRMYNCVIRLIEKNGIGATEAQKVCESTLRRM